MINVAQTFSYKSVLYALLEPILENELSLKKKVDLFVPSSYLGELDFDIFV